MLRDLVRIRRTGYDAVGATVLKREAEGGGWLSAEEEDTPRPLS